MSEEEKIIADSATTLIQSPKEIDDREEVVQLLIFKTEKEGHDAFAAKQRFENEQRQRVSGETFTVGGLKEEYRLYIAEIEKDYEPKFALFLKRLGTLCKWTPEEMARFSKPRIAPITIIELFYNRFPEGIVKYLQENNRYVGNFIRRTKNYKLLNEEGIRKLETFIDDANTLMPECQDYYEFRQKMFENFGVPYQKELFEGLI